MRIYWGLLYLVFSMHASDRTEGVAYVGGRPVEIPCVVGQVVSGSCKDVPMAKVVGVVEPVAIHLIRQKKSQELVTLGSCAPKVLHRKGSFGATPLITIAWDKDRDTDVARALLESGADVNAATVNGTTPLIAACYAGTRANEWFIDALIERGAHVSASMHKKRPIIGAAASCSGKTIDLLVLMGDKVNAVDKHGYTPLMRAAVTGNRKAGKALLHHGADKDIKNVWGQTALDLANQAKHQKFIKILQKTK